MPKINYISRMRVVEAIYQYQGRDFGKRFHLSNKQVSDLREGRMTKLPAKLRNRSGETKISRSFRYYKNETDYTFIVKNEYVGKGDDGKYFTFGFEEFSTDMGHFDKEFNRRLDSAVEEIAEAYPEYQGEVEVKTVVSRVRRH